MSYQTDVELVPTEVNRLWNLGVQIVLIGGAVLLYFAVRGQTQGSETAAVAHGLDLLRFEQSLGLAVEADLQQSVLDSRWLVTAMNWIYIWGHWPIITVTLVWLYRTRRLDYLLLRNALFASGAIGLVIFIFYPVAPPRLLPDGFVDTVTELSTSYRVLQPPSLVNKYAALPSLHVGWNLLIGIAIFRTRVNVWARVFGVVSPILMVAAVVLTGNHYLIDGVVGATVALVGLGVSVWLTPKIAFAGRDGVRRRLGRSALPTQRQVSAEAGAQVEWVPLPIRSGSRIRATTPSAGLAASRIRQSERSLTKSIPNVTR